MGNDPVNKWDANGECLPFCAAPFILAPEISAALATIGAFFAAESGSIAVATVVVGGSIILSSDNAGGDDGIPAQAPDGRPVTPVSGQPGFEGEPGEWESGTDQDRLYGEDGYPETDVDYGHDHGQGQPHAHDWDRPSEGGQPTHGDRGRGRPPTDDEKIDRPRRPRNTDDDSSKKPEQS